MDHSKLRTETDALVQGVEDGDEAANVVAQEHHVSQRRNGTVGPTGSPWQSAKHAREEWGESAMEAAVISRVPRDVRAAYRTGYVRGAGERAAELHAVLTKEEGT